MAGTDVGEFVRAVDPCVAQLCESDGTVFALLGSHEEVCHVMTDMFQFPYVLIGSKCGCPMQAHQLCWCRSPG